MTECHTMDRLESYGRLMFDSFIDSDHRHWRHQVGFELVLSINSEHSEQGSRYLQIKQYTAEVNNWSAHYTYRTYNSFHVHTGKVPLYLLEISSNALLSQEPTPIFHFTNLAKKLYLSFHFSPIRMLEAIKMFDFSDEQTVNLLLVANKRTSIDERGTRSQENIERHKWKRFRANDKNVETSQYVQNLVRNVIIIFRGRPTHRICQRGKYQFKIQGVPRVLFTLIDHRSVHNRLGTTP